MRPCIQLTTQAVPPWIELQNEVDAMTESFRAGVRESWQRRALRMLSLGTITPTVIASAATFRDAEWAQREQRFHAVSVEQLVDKTRSYNHLAPYVARRRYATETRVYLRPVGFNGLARCYADSAPIITAELERRAREGLHGGTIAHGPSSPGARAREAGPDLKADQDLRIWPALKRAVAEVFARR